MIAKRPARKLLIFSALAVLSGAMAMAQSQPGGMGQQQPTPGQQPGMQSNPGEMPGAADAGNAPSIADQAFVRAIMESDAAEVQLGQLAQEKSQSDDTLSLNASSS